MGQKVVGFREWGLFVWSCGFSLVAFMLVSSTVFVRIRTQTFLENEIVLSLLWKMAGHG